MNKIVKETDRYVWVEYNHSYRSRPTISKERKFLCVGGPFNQLAKSGSQVCGPFADGKYEGYNSAGGNGPSRIFVWFGE